MTPDAGLTRRRVLALLGAGGAAALAGTGIVVAIGRTDRDGGDDDGGHAADAVPLRDALVRLGEAVNAAHPALVDQAPEVLGPELTPEAVAADPATALSGARDRIAEEYARGEVLDVAGWVLSRTECCVAAIVARG